MGIEIRIGKADDNDDEIVYELSGSAAKMSGAGNKTSHPLPKQLDAHLTDYLKAVSDNLPADELRRVGEALHSQLFPEKLRTALLSAEPESIRLKFDMPSAAAMWPWEILYHDEAFWGCRFLLGRLILSEDPDRKANQPTAQAKVLIFRGYDKGLTHLDREIETILRNGNERFSCHSSVYEFDKKKLRDALKDELESCHVFHYLGHSRWDKKRIRQSGLQLAEDTWFTANDIAGLKKCPKLVFLNSCLSCATSETDGLSGIAGAFLKAGVEAVVGTAAKISDDVAASMAKFFYESFFSGESTAESLRYAREQIAKNGRSAWAAYRYYGDPLMDIFPTANAKRGRPSDSTSKKNGESFAEFAKRCNAKTLSKIEELKSHPLYIPPEAYVRREGVEDELEDFIEGRAGGMAAKLVLGESGYGKSTLLCHLAEEYANPGSGKDSRDTAVIYIRVEDYHYETLIQHLNRATDIKFDSGDFVAGIQTLFGENNAPAPSKRRVLVVIDGIDSAGGNAKALLLDVRALTYACEEYNRKTPGNSVRLLLSMRPSDYWSRSTEARGDDPKEFSFSVSYPMEYSGDSQQKRPVVFDKPGDQDDDAEQSAPKQQIILRLQPFNENKTRLAFEKYGKSIAKEDFAQHWEDLHPSVRDLIARPLLLNCYFSIYPAQNPAPTTELSEKKLWEEFFAKAIYGDKRDKDVEGFLYGLLMPCCYDNKRLSISLDMVDKISENADKNRRRRLGSTFEAWDILVSKGVLYKNDDREPGYHFEHDAVGEHALAEYLRRAHMDKISSYAFFKQQSLHCTKFAGLSGALVELLSNSWWRGDTRAWDEWISDGPQDRSMMESDPLAGILSEALVNVIQQRGNGLDAKDQNGELVDSCLVQQWSDIVQKGAQSRESFERLVLLTQQSFVKNFLPDAVDSDGISLVARIILSVVAGGENYVASMIASNGQTVQLACGLLADVRSCESAIGILLSDIGENHAAIAHFRRAVLIGERLVAKEPLNAEFQYLLGTSMNRLADLYADIGKKVDALDLLRRDFKISESIVDAEPLNRKYRNGLVSTMNRLSDLYIEFGEEESAMKLLLRALQESERIVAEEPLNRKYRNWLAATANRLADLFLDMGRPQDASKLLLQALSIREQLNSEETVNRQYRDGLAATLYRIAGVHIDMEEMEDALKVLLRALEICQDLSAEEPLNIAYTYALSMTKNRLARVYTDMKRREDALKLFLDNLQVNESLVAADPMNREYQNGLGVTLSLLADLSVDMGKKEDALKYRLRDLEISERLAAEEPLNRKYQDGLAVTLNRLAGLFEDMDKKKESLKYREHALGIRERLVAEEPLNRKYQDGLAVTLEKLCAHFSGMNDSANELSRRRQELDVRKKLCVLEPANEEYQMKHDACRQRIAELEAVGQRSS